MAAATLRTNRSGNKQNSAAEATDSRWVERIGAALTGFTARAAAAITVTLAAAVLLVAATPTAGTAGDATQLYLPAAANIRAHGAYSVMTAPPYLPTIVKMPGYSALLAVIQTVAGPGLRPIQAVQLAAVAATALLAAHTTRRLFGARAGLIAGILTAAYPGLAFHAMQPLSETVTALLLMAHTAALLSAIRNPQRVRAPLLAAAVTLGGLALVRQSFAALLPLVTVALALTFRPRGWRQALRQAGAFVAVTTAIVLPWCVRNVHVSGQFLPFGANSGMSLLVSVRQYAETAERPVFYVETVKEQTALVDERLGVADGAAKDFDQGLGGGPQREAAIDRQLTELARTEAAQLRPAQVAAKLPGRLIDEWSGTTANQGLNSIENALMIAAAASLLRLRRQLRQLWPIVLPALYLTALHLVFHTEARYTLPARPALLIALAALAGSVWQHRKPLAAQRSVESATS